jgi:hypothetical protein
LRLVLGADAQVAEWAAAKLGQAIVPPYVCFGIVGESGLCGAIIFNSYTGPNIDVTVYGPGCGKRRFIRAAYDYAFNQAKALRLTAQTRRGNVVARRLLPRLGFTFEATLKRYFGPTRQDDALSFALFPEDAARWMRD